MSDRQAIDFAVFPREQQEQVEQMSLCNNVDNPPDSEDISAETDAASITEEDDSLTEEDTEVETMKLELMKLETNDEATISKIPSTQSATYKKFPKIRTLEPLLPGHWDHPALCMCPQCLFRAQAAQDPHSPMQSPHFLAPSQQSQSLPQQQQPPFQSNTQSAPFATVNPLPSTTPAPTPSSPNRTRAPTVKQRETGINNLTHAKLNVGHNHLPATYEEKPYVCQYCAKKFSTSRYLEVHLRIHTGEKPFGCADCGKRFTQEIHLTTHRRTHSDEKPYICLECGKGFSQPNNLRTHRRIHLEEKPFSCPNPDCKKKFSDQSNYKRHLRTSGHGGPTPIQYQQANLCVYEGVRYM